MALDLDADANPDLAHYLSLSSSSNVISRTGGPTWYAGFAHGDSSPTGDGSEIVALTIKKPKRAAKENDWRESRRIKGKLRINN